MGAIWTDGALIDKIQTLLNNIVGRGSVDVRYHGNGIEIYAPEAGLAGGPSYYAPFTVVKASDTSVTILGYNADEGRPWKNYLALGNSYVEAAEATVSSITSTGYLYLEITYSSSYTLTFKFSAGETPPAQSNTVGVLIVRRIVCTDSKITSINNPTNIVNMGGKIF